MPTLSDYDRGWLVASIEADAGIYSERRDSTRDSGVRRRVVLDFELGNREQAERLSAALCTNPPSTRSPRDDAVIRARATHRVRLRGERASTLLLDLLPDFTAETRARVERAVAGANLTTPGALPPPHPSLKLDTA